MPTSEATSDINDLVSRRVGLEASRSIAEKARNGFLARYLSGNDILDIGYRGYSEDVEPIVPQAVGVELDYPGYDGRVLPFADQSQDAVFSSHCLEHIEDYKSALREWHRVLKIGGFMVIAVPHKFLYERRTNLPSKWNPDHKRFYTPASLMAEIEEALAPNTYRLRHLIDHDFCYDYTVPLEFHPGGCYEIELVIERIAPPDWFLETTPLDVSLPSSELSGAEEHGPAMHAQTEATEAARLFSTVGENSFPGSNSDLTEPATLADALPTTTLFGQTYRRFKRIRAFPRQIFAALTDLRDEVVTLQKMLKIATAEARSESAAARAEKIVHRLEDVQFQTATAATLAALQSLVVSKSEIGMRQIRAAMNELTSLVENESQAATANTATQKAQIDYVAAAIDEALRRFPVAEDTPEVASAIRAVLALISPQDVIDVPKIRIGRHFDGGYIMLNAFQSIRAALSLGISDDVSWDTDIAERGIRVLQFDPTVSGPPVWNANFEFKPLRVGPRDEEGVVSLTTIVESQVGRADEALLLKIDVEGAEWDIFSSTESGILERFEQIVCEFHAMHQLADPAFLAQVKDVFEKLARTHFVYHVHGNNCGSFVNLGNVVFPDTLEVSFARRSRFAQAHAALGLFPSDIDQPNQPGRADLYLGNFQF